MTKKSDKTFWAQKEFDEVKMANKENASSNNVEHDTYELNTIQKIIKT